MILLIMISICWCLFDLGHLEVQLAGVFRSKVRTNGYHAIAQEVDTHFEVIKIIDSHTSHTAIFQNQNNNMSGDGLNTGASTFTPGGSAAPPSQDSFTQYAEMMDDIETQVETPAATAFVPTVETSALPAHLARHAAEFWFPEARNCQCCNGYKHGCTCCETNGGSCKCSVGSLRPAPPGPSGGGRGSGGRGGGNAWGGAGGRGGGGKAPCKFFRSSGGCRFGDSCRFAHE